MNRLSKVLILCMIMHIVFSLSHVNGEEKKCHSRLESTCARNALIVRSFENEKKYTTIKDVLVFKKILVGKWISEPGTLSIFNANGNFELIHSERPKDVTRYLGKWDVKENSLWLQYNNVGPWKKYEIKYYQLSDATKDSGADYLSPSEFRYSFEVGFKNGERWFADLMFEFNVDK